VQAQSALNHRKKMKAEPSRLIPRKLAVSLSALICFVFFASELNFFSKTCPALSYFA